MTDARITRNLAKHRSEASYVRSEKRWGSGNPARPASKAHNKAIRRAGRRECAGWISAQR
jgi:hypothetical protein